MLLVCLLTGNGSEMFISLVISVYPGYKSIKGLSSKSIHDNQLIIMFRLCSARRLRMTRGG